MSIGKGSSIKSKIVASLLAVTLVMVSFFLWDQNKVWVPKKGECLLFEGQVYRIVWADPEVLTVNLNFNQTLDNPYTPDMLNIKLSKEELTSKGFSKTKCIHTRNFFTD